MARFKINVGRKKFYPVGNHKKGYFKMQIVTGSLVKNSLRKWYVGRFTFD